MNNNPVNLTDPTGHYACWDDDSNNLGCKPYTPTGYGLRPKDISLKQVTPVTQGFSGIISGTMAAEGALAVAVTAPIDEKELHIDPYSGQLPPTIYIGGGAGGAYAGIGAGINGPTGVYINLTPFLPWRWNK